MQGKNELLPYKNEHYKNITSIRQPPLCQNHAETKTELYKSLKTELYVAIKTEHYRPTKTEHYNPFKTEHYKPTKTEHYRQSRATLRTGII